MSDLKTILNEEYEKKNTLSVVPNLLFKLIEEALETPLTIIKEYAMKERTFSVSMIPDIEVSELGWSDMRTPKEGAPAVANKTERDVLKDYLDNIIGDVTGEGGMAELPQKLQVLSDLAENPATYVDGIQDAGLSTGAKLQRVISFLVFYKTLTKIIANFNASSAGFSFESFLATLLGGKQIPASGATTIADFVDANQLPVSLKLYAERGVEVGGSFDAIVGDVINNSRMTYLVVTKDLRGSRENMSGTLKFYQFEFNLDNILDIVSRTKAFSARCAILPFAEAQEGEEEALQVIRDEEGNIVTDIEKVRFNPEPIQDEYAAKLADKLAAAAGKGGWAGKLKALREIPFPALSMDEIVANSFFNYKEPEHSYIATDSPGKPFPSRGARFEEMIAQLRTVPSIQAGERQLAETVPETYGDVVINAFLKTAAGFIRQSLGEVLKDYLQRRTARKTKVGALDIPQYKLPKRDDKAEVKKQKIEAIEEAAARSAEWYNRQDEATKKAALLKTNGYLNDLQFAVGKTEMLDLAQKNEIKGWKEWTANGNPLGAELGELTIGMTSLQTMLNKSIAALNTDIFSIFKDLEELSTSLNTFFSKGLAGDEANKAAKTAIDRSNDIEGKTKEAKSDE